MPTESPLPDSSWVRRLKTRIKKKKCTTCGGECTDCPYAEQRQAEDGRQEAAAAGQSGTGEAAPAANGSHAGRSRNRARDPRPAKKRLQ